MGTSSGHAGPATGLVPSWADDPMPSVAPIAPLDGTVDPGMPGMRPPVEPTQPMRPLPPQPDASAAGTLGAARGSFTRFARTGSRAALGSALSNYVRHGT